jgi:hypothetical protein
MSEFTFMYRGLDFHASPDQMQRTMEHWRAWFNDLEAKGHLKDFGHPLENAGAVVSGKNKVVNDGPFAEAKDLIAGFSIIEARDLSQATELAKGCPILEAEGSVEVRPTQILNR